VIKLMEDEQTKIRIGSAESVDESLIEEEARRGKTFHGCTLDRLTQPYVQKREYLLHVERGGGDKIEDALTDGALFLRGR
jgi:hypothetical protein